MIGVIGGYGSVGRATVAQLRAWGLGPIVVAGRDPARAEVVVDAEEPAGLDRFSASLRLVVNCTGSPHRSRAAVARAAARTGVPYIDPDGDEPLHELLSGGSYARPVVLSAGMLPGLTGLLPRLLAPEPGGRLLCYSGGQDLFTIAAAADYLAAVDRSADRTFAVWRDGRRVERAGVAVLEGDVPYFSEPASGVPFLSPEMERLASRLKLAELVFYSVFPGSRLRAALVAAQVDAEAVVRASELDAFGRSRYQRLAFQLNGGPALVLSGRGSSELTGATAAMTALAVMEGGVPAGLHFAADVLDTAWARERLAETDAVTGLRIFEARAPAESPELEEGAI